MGVDHAAFAFLAINGNLIALLQVRDQQVADLLALAIEHERALLDPDGGGFDLSIFLCSVGTRDDIPLGMVRMGGDAGHADYAPALPQFLDLPAKFLSRLCYFLLLLLPRGKLLLPLLSPPCGLLEGLLVDRFFKH